jgi:putative proteasome-type protease
MTYCVGMKLDAGLVLLADSRTNAGVDHISTFRKMLTFERPGERVLVLLSAGNLAITQAVIAELALLPEEESLWQVSSMALAVATVGAAVKRVHARDAPSLAQFKVDFNLSLILGGQIKGGGMRLFLVYAAGNFIEAQDETCYFQIGEAKYGKPIIDRVVSPSTPLDEAAKCALISMDSTLRSNLSVGLPLDLMCYEKDSFVVGKFAHVDAENQYFQMIHSTWGERLRQVFEEIPDPLWQTGSSQPDRHLLGNAKGPMRAPAAGEALAGMDVARAQVLMQEAPRPQDE